jgi:hypothetical protein
MEEPATPDRMGTNAAARHEPIKRPGTHPEVVGGLVSAEPRRPGVVTQMLEDNRSGPLRDHLKNLVWKLNAKPHSPISADS